MTWSTAEKLLSAGSLYSFPGHVEWQHVLLVFIENDILTVYSYYGRCLNFDLGHNICNP